MMNEKTFLTDTSEIQLPMITVNSLNEIVDYNESCFPNIGRSDIGLEIEIRPLVNSKQKSFPYTAVLTLKEKEYLACVSLANPNSEEYKNIYFSDPASENPDALLTSRFIIEQKYTELHSRTSFLSDRDTAFRKLQKLTMLSHISTEEKANEVSLEKIVEYTIVSYQNRFEKAKGKTLCFSCKPLDVPINENITSLTVSLVALGMMLLDKEADFIVSETPLQYVFELVLKNKRFMGDISAFGFSGMFLSRISCLNYWNTELAYNALKNETTFKIFVPKSSASYRFSAEQYVFNVMAYAELLVDAFTM